LEAVQGRHYARHLRQKRANAPRPPLETFADHAAYYSFHRQELLRTVLDRAGPATGETDSPDESLALLYGRLGERSPVLMRNLTPPLPAGTGLDWRVVKVIVPGLQPLHGDDRFAHLGGRLWSSRGLKEWSETPPHPFP